MSEREREQGRWRRKREGELRSNGVGPKATLPTKNSWAEHASTYFFSNFPDSHGEYDMFRIFRKWARVKEVFISRRLNRWGRRFGFVRFFPVPNEASMEKQLDGIFIGSLKLHVNLPKYRRAEMEQKYEKTSYASKDYRHTNRPMGKREQYARGTWCENTNRVYYRGDNLKPKLSYAEAVRSPAQGIWKGPVFETASNTPPWLVTSAVGRMSPDVSFETLREEFVKGGMSRVKLRFMGDNLVLLTPNNSERLEEIIKLNNDWFNSLFVSLEPWSESYVAGHKIVWVRCYGLLLSLWNKDCFSKVVS